MEGFVIGKALGPRGRRVRVNTVAAAVCRGQTLWLTRCRFLSPLLHEIVIQALVCSICVAGDSFLIAADLCSREAAIVMALSDLFEQFLFSSSL
jgi:hypothetical protein